MSHSLPTRTATDHATIPHDHGAFIPPKPIGWLRILQEKCPQLIITCEHDDFAWTWTFVGRARAGTDPALVMSNDPKRFLSAMRGEGFTG